MLRLAARQPARLHRAIARFVGDTRAAMVIEFAFVAPILAGLALSVADYGRYVLLNQKMNRTATSLADLVAREDQLSIADFAGIFAAAEHIMVPFELGNDGVLVLTIVAVNADDEPRIIERQEYPSGAAYEGQYGDVNDLFEGGPDGLLEVEGDVLVVAETRFVHDSWLVDLLSDQSDLYHVAYARPRGNISEFLSES